MKMHLFSRLEANVRSKLDAELRAYLGRGASAETWDRMRELAARCWHQTRGAEMIEAAQRGER